MTADLHIADVPAQSSGTLRVSPVNLFAGLFGALVLTTLFLCGMLILAGRADWWAGLLPAVVVSAMAAVVSAIPVLVGLRFGMNGAVAGFFVSMGLRAIVSLGGCLFAAKVGHYPQSPTMLLMVPYYFALVAVETGLLAKTLWTAKA